MRTLQSILGRLLLLTVSVGLSVTLAEAAVRVLDLLRDQRAALGRIQSMEHQRQESAAAVRSSLHPYRGWTHRPGRKVEWVLKGAQRIFGEGRPHEWALRNREIGLFGASSQVRDYRLLDPDEFVVAVFGGSVAAQLVVLAGDHLETELARRLDLPPGSVRVINMGLGGYKQPQQLFALAELALLGVELDLVVNVDGFNEVVAGEQNARAGFHPFFPKKTKLSTIVALSSKSPTQEQILISADIIRERRIIDRWRRWADSSPVARSWLTRGMVGWLVQRSELTIARSEERLNATATGTEEPLASLPDECLGRRHACWELIGDLWVASSRLMQQTAGTIGAGYVHILQPNQYLPGSKPLSAVERQDMAGNPFHQMFAESVSRGYADLRSRAAELTASGVAFRDLSQLFRTTPETIYSDGCCHYNLVGNRMLAAAVTAVVASSERP